MLDTDKKKVSTCLLYSNILLAIIVWQWYLVMMCTWTEVCLGIDSWHVHMPVCLVNVPLPSPPIVVTHPHPQSSSAVSVGTWLNITGILSDHDLFQGVRHETSVRVSPIGYHKFGRGGCRLGRGASALFNQRLAVTQRPLGMVSAVCIRGLILSFALCCILNEGVTGIPADIHLSREMCSVQRIAIEKIWFGVGPVKRILSVLNAIAVIIDSHTWRAERLKSVRESRTGHHPGHFRKIFYTFFATSGFTFCSCKVFSWGGPNLWVMNLHVECERCMSVSCNVQMVRENRYNHVIAKVLQVKIYQ